MQESPSLGSNCEQREADSCRRGKIGERRGNEASAVENRYEATATED
jgi:hypothetical protein